MSSALKIIDTACASSRAPELNIVSSEDPAANGAFKGRAAVVTLGCAKNQVDSEVMLGVLKSRGFEIVGDVKEADVVVVNTCGFLESAVKESIDCVLDLARLKETGRLRKLIVAGCAVERYQGDISEALPEVDSFISVNDILKVGTAAEGNLGRLLEQGSRPYFLYDDTVPRYLSTQRHTAYVKISEGCNRPCTFCIIPKIRGPLRSRTIDSVLKEVSDLAELGVKEVNLIAQDLTAYGSESKSADLAQLLRRIDQAGQMNWVRLLYAYPLGINAELLDAIWELPSVCEYLDLPLQHSSNSVLKPMQRPLGKFAPRNLVEFIKTRQPGIQLRTTFIVGFPGESEADISDLEGFVSAGHFSSVGVFLYSPEPGTPAHDMPGQISDREKTERKERIMRAQQKALKAKLDAYVGQNLEVLVEGSHEDTDLLLSARTRFQAPEVDGTVIINDSNFEATMPGHIGKVQVQEVLGYDLVGKLIA